MFVTKILARKRMKIIIHLFISTICCCTTVQFVAAQPGSSIDIEKQKPEKYENRRLNAEKTGEKKLTAPKRFFQNNFTHYNYFFNANNKVNTIINKAKLSFKDDYTQLLPFYNYTLNATAEEKLEIDSIIYKTTAGILLHNLENAWIDDLYLLMGKSYLLKKDFDSAKFVFQYINYAWSPKDDGYDILLGSNTSNTNGVFTIVTKEKKNAIAKVLTKEPVRNESFLWQARTLLEQDKIAEASGLLSLLKADANFPKRLQTDFDEILAYAYYKQQSYDSAASHLNKALNNAENRTERARWHFLCGQLYALAGNKTDAAKHFEKSVALATDPLMEVYARLNLVNTANQTKESIVSNNLEELYKLAKKEKFEEQRDMILYAAAILEEKQLNTKAAINTLKKSIAATTDNLTQRNKSFTLLGDLFFSQKKYQEAYNAYDSIAIDNLVDADKERVAYRKTALKIITQNNTVIHFEDSVKIIAQMPEAERNAFVRKLVKKLRKAEGLKEEENIDFGSENNLPINGSNTAPTTVNIFGNTASPNDFYFNNPSIKQKGNAEFKSKWGTRPNVDNWRRQAVFANINQNSPANNGPVAVSDVDDAPPSSLQSVSDNVQTPAIKDISFEGLMKDIPLQEDQKITAEKRIADALFDNAVTYQNHLKEYEIAITTYNQFLTAHNTDKRKEQALYNLQFCYARLGLTKQQDSVKAIMQQQFANGAYQQLLQNTPEKKANTLTSTYENIYNLFIEGRYEEAIVSKQAADKTLGKSYWQPQLLWIESIYYIKQQKDSTAIQVLQQLIQQFPENALALKAQTMIDVLYRRKEIEAHLTNYNEPRKEDTIIQKRVDLVESAPIVQDKKANITVKDTVANKLPTLINTTPILNNTPIVTNEAKGFTFTPTDAHFVVLVLNKVDEVYVNEAKNAFTRFNAERFYNQKINIAIEKINNEYVFLLFSNFNNAGEAIAYIDQVKPSVANRIIPWLPAAKYYFSMINNNNLTLLKSNKEVNNYQQFIHQVFPDKF